eukprot:GFUD01009062.1.p1 GENE.GFUD01009062.1~~GFUD01009062.1.p1  ORF type:complete len:446 (+),score=134.44 GFUD01009062.1:82-1419(+)
MAQNGVAAPTHDFSQEDLYKLGLTFYKENEGRNFHLAYQDKIDLVAFTQQANHGSLKQANLPPLGTLDIIGKERRAAWEKLGELGKEEAKSSFTSQLLKLAPGFQEFVVDQSKAEIEKHIVEEKLQKEKIEEDIKTKAREEERLKEETQRRAIQDALNKQTFQQFKGYAEQQYPGNVDQQALLIKQLQEQHYYQYMHQLYQQQQCGTSGADNTIEMTAVAGDMLQNGENGEEHETSLVEIGETTQTIIERGLDELKLEEKPADMNGGEEGEEFTEPEEASMWTRKEIHEFKDTIRKEEGEAIIKIGHGETVTVRVPTHIDGRSLYWEFATDSYDIGFGLFFEWVDPEDTQVTVHISDSEEEEEEYVTDEDNPDNDGDAEGGGRGLLVDNGPPTSCIIPIYRRDCHEEVYAGSHTYPRQGVYQLKFDNSYSLWRSKTLYYRVYYTR